MKICIFFGHRNTPSEIRDKLKETIVRLIEEKDVTRFYVGNHGNFDRLVLSVLKELSVMYPQIDYSVVIAYLPVHPAGYSGNDNSHTVYPEGIEAVPKRFAISFRNKWMIQRADIVIAYVNRSVGGAAKFTDMARKRGKEIINI